MESVRNLDYIQIFNDQITPYGPLDVQNFKPNSTIKTPKDLEKESKTICEILKDAKSKFYKKFVTMFLETDWSVRMKAI